MTRPVLLDNVTHRHLRVRPERSAALGDARQSALALPAEFRQLQAHFPIVFQRVEGDAANAGFQPVALFGLEEGDALIGISPADPVPFIENGLGKPGKARSRQTIIGMLGPEDVK